VYDSPSNDWYGATASREWTIGQWFLGNIEKEHLQLNDESLWGQVKSRENPYPPNVREHYKTLSAN